MRLCLFVCVCVFALALHTILNAPALLNAICNCFLLLIILVVVVVVVAVVVVIVVSLLSQSILCASFRELKF